MPNLPKCLLGTEPRLVKGGTAAPERPRCGTQLCRDRARREQPGLNGMTSGVSSMKKCGDDSDSASHAYHTARLVHTRHSMNRMSKLALSTGSESFYFPKHKVDKDTIKIKKKQKQRNDWRRVSSVREMPRKRRGGLVNNPSWSEMKMPFPASGAAILGFWFHKKASSCSCSLCTYKIHPMGSAWTTAGTVVFLKEQ